MLLIPANFRQSVSAIAFSLLLTHLTPATCLAAQARESQPHPNIVVIMADDLGYGDVSCYGARSVQTPNIDKLAAEGRRFTNGYCSASTCTPTRYSFLTGRYAFRGERTGIAPPNAPAIIKPGTETIASILHAAGYATAVIGKWHLGLGGPEGPDWNGELKPGPLEIGFDTCFLLPTTNDRVPQVYVHNHRVPNLDPADPLWVGNSQPSADHPTGITHRGSLKMDWSHGHNSTIHNGISRIGFYTGGHSARFRDEDLADKWVEQSVKFMKENKNRPFFLFFASHDIHVPRIPHERFQGATSLGFRGDAIVEFDWCVGEISNALDQLGIAENTLIVVCSDNGPVLDDGYKDGAIEKIGTHKAAGPFRGGKYSVFEGGTRTPFISRWKGRIQPGVSEEIVCTIDLARSCAALTNQPVPENAFSDSQDVMDCLLGKDGARGREHLVQQDNGSSGTFGFRSGQWKLHRYDRKTARNVVVEKELTNTKVQQFQLYDLKADPGETTNIIDKHPDLAEQLKKKLAQLIEAP
ncbi:MAG: arylsulfatase [Planctomycetaceae bacterium]